jgi:hypothetical protein
MECTPWVRHKNKEQVAIGSSSVERAMVVCPFGENFLPTAGSDRSAACVTLRSALGAIQGGPTKSVLPPMIASL